MPRKKKQPEDLEVIVEQKLAPVAPSVNVDLATHAGCADLVSAATELVLAGAIELDMGNFLLKCAESASRIHATVARERRARFKEEIESKTENRMGAGTAALIELAKERS